MAVIHLETENFKEISKKGVVIVDFFATWCGPCKMIAPIFEKVAGEFNNVTFIKVDVDKHEDLAREYGVMSIPTIVILKDGKEVEKNVGFMSDEALRGLIKKYVKE